LRAKQITGAILIALGLLILIRPPSYSREQSVVKWGSFEAKVQKQQEVPEFVGGIALGIGLVLLVSGFKKR
jgi:drug/metabolite transporter (DMT)-like permease